MYAIWFSQTVMGLHRRFLGGCPLALLSSLLPQETSPVRQEKDSSTSVYSVVSKFLLWLNVLVEFTNARTLHSEIFLNYSKIACKRKYIQLPLRQEQSSQCLRAKKPVMFSKLVDLPAFFSEDGE